jgi:hypothetical protein
LRPALTKFFAKLPNQFAIGTAGHIVS